jgi:rhodanese-related sulfurtransferase
MASIGVRRLRSIVLAAAIVVVVAGCGSDGGGGGASTSVRNETTAVPVAGAALTKVTPQQGADLVQQLGGALTIIDVRTPEEFAAGHLEHAVNFDIEAGQFSAQIAPLDRAAPYMVYCHSGRRSAIAADAMVAAGFTQVYDVGGIADWQAAGLPVVTG